MKEKIALLGIVTNLGLALGKIIIGFLARSNSVLAEGIHSGMDVISSTISLIGIKIAQKPVDKEHPYGHYKFEVLSGLVITAILFGTGIGIIYKAYKSFLNPEIIQMSYLALGIMGLSAILNEIMARLKIYYGKKENSLGLLSDGIHDKIDVYSSIIILIGLVMTPYWAYMDAVLTLIIGLYILKESFSLGKHATDSLLDVSAGDEIESQIKELAQTQNIEISELKTQKRGSVITANIEILLSSQLNIEEATKISNSFKETLIKNIEHLEYIAIQIKSHNVTDSYYKPKDIIGKINRNGIRWQKKGQYKNPIKESQGKGPKGYCICPKCGYKVKHERETPCSTIECPKCGEKLTRE